MASLHSLDAALGAYTSGGCDSKPPTDAACRELTTRLYAARTAYEQAQTAVVASEEEGSSGSSSSSTEVAVAVAVTTVVIGSITAGIYYYNKYRSNLAQQVDGQFAFAPTHNVANPTFAHPDDGEL